MVGDDLRDGIFLRKISETIKRNTIATIKHTILMPGTGSNGSPVSQQSSIEILVM